MNHFDNQCPYCKRIYRGNGYQGHCTEDCYHIKQHNDSLPKKGVFSTYKLKKPKAPGVAAQQIYNKEKYQIIREEKLQKANEKWLARTPEMLEKEREAASRKKRQYNFAYNSTFFQEAQEQELKKFNSVRG